MIYLKVIISSVFVSVLFNTVDAQVDSVKAFHSGKNIFQTHCSPCHGVHKEIVGPALGSITRKRSQEWLISFIKNSQEVILSGDEYAIFLYEQYNRTVMPSFLKLSDEQIRDILIYIERESVRPTKAVDKVTNVNIGPGRPTILRGEELFRNQCASCHSMGVETYGPALASVTKRLPQSWLIRFIEDSQEVIQSGDPYAVNLFNEYDQKIMVAMEFLDRDDILAILDYMEYASASPSPVAGVNGINVPQPVPYRVYDIDIPPQPESRQQFFKLFFIVISAFGAIVHSYLIIRLFLYLAKE